MNFWIAKKYFFSLKKGSTINIISLITVIGITFSTASMIFVLSIFNGFEGLVTNLYKGYVPDFKIESIKGSYFNTDSIIDTQLNQTIIDKLNNYEDYISFSEVLEQEVILEYEKENKKEIDYPKIFSKIKAVDVNYLKYSELSKYILLESEKYPFILNEYSKLIIIGASVANKLNLQVANNYDEAFNQINNLKIWTLNTTNKKPQLFFRKGFINSGIFSISPEIDNNIFCSIALAREFLEKPNKSSSIEIWKKNIIKKDFTKKLQNELGPGFIVKNFEEQVPFLYKMVNTERIAVYLIFILILLVTMITLMGSLIIFILQKREDMQILVVLGSNHQNLKKIFMIWGQIIVIIGLMIGLVFGYSICVLQNNLHFLKIKGNFIIDYYPVEINPFDGIIIISIVYALGFITSYVISKKNYFYKDLIYD